MFKSFLFCVVVAFYLEISTNLKPSLYVERNKNTLTIDDF